MELRLPNIDPKASPEQQLSQLKNYLYQTVEQLNWALSVVEKNTDSIAQKVEKVSSSSESTNKAIETFDEIKNLIIKDADIVKSYGEELRKTYDKEYIAQSDFGTYQESVSSAITESADGLRVDIKAAYDLASEAATFSKEAQQYVKVGSLGTDQNGNFIAGMEIGDTVNGRKYARYDNIGTHLYNENGAESVTIAEGKTKFSGNVTMDMLSVEGFSLDGNDSGLGLYWEG